MLALSDRLASQRLAYDRLLLHLDRKAGWSSGDPAWLRLVLAFVQPGIWMSPNWEMSIIICHLALKVTFWSLAERKELHQLYGHSPTLDHSISSWDR